MNELVKIDPKEYGLTEQKAKEVETAFIPMIEKMNELESVFNEIVSTEITQDLCVQAKDLRLQYVKIRTATANIHKEAKSFYLAGGRFVDGWKNAQLYASQGKEQKLSDIENYYINIEKNRIEGVKVERESLLSKYDQEFIPSGLGEMNDEVWKNYYTGVTLAYDQKKQAEEKAELDRIEAEKAYKAEQERIKLENEQLKIEAAKKEKALEKERLENQAKLDAERKANEAREKALREEKEKLERENQAKLDAEKKAQEDEKNRLLSLQSAPDKEKLISFVDRIESIEFPSVVSEKAKTIFSNAYAQLCNVSKYIIEQVDKL